MPQSWLQHSNPRGHNPSSHNSSSHNSSGNRQQNYEHSSNSGTNVLSMILILCILAAAGYYGYKYWKGDFKNTEQKKEDANNTSLEAKVKAACAAAEAKVRKEAADQEKLEKTGTCSNNIVKTKSECENSFFCSDPTKLTEDTCIAIKDATWSPHVWIPQQNVSVSEGPVDGPTLNESFTGTNTINANDPFDEKYMSYNDLV